MSTPRIESSQLESLSKRTDTEAARTIYQLMKDQKIPESEYNKFLPHRRAVANHIIDGLQGDEQKEALWRALVAPDSIFWKKRWFEESPLDVPNSPLHDIYSKLSSIDPKLAQHFFYVKNAHNGSRNILVNKVVSRVLKDTVLTTKQKLELLHIKVNIHGEFGGSYDEIAYGCEGETLTELAQFMMSSLDDENLQDKDFLWLVNYGKLPALQYINKLPVGEKKESLLWQSLFQDTRLGKLFFAKRGFTKTNYQRGTLKSIFEGLKKINPELAKMYAEVDKAINSGEPSEIRRVGKLLADSKIITLQQKLDLAGLKNKDGDTFCNIANAYKLNLMAEINKPPVVAQFHHRVGEPVVCKQDDVSLNQLLKNMWEWYAQNMAAGNIQQAAIWARRIALADPNNRLAQYTHEICQGILLKQHGLHEAAATVFKSAKEAYPEVVRSIPYKDQLAAFMQEKTAAVLPEKSSFQEKENSQMASQQPVAKEKQVVTSVSANQLFGEKQSSVKASSTVATVVKQASNIHRLFATLRSLVVPKSPLPNEIQLQEKDRVKLMG